MRFFADSPTPTKIRWYFVPADRPTLPVASFVGRPEWTDDNGVFSAMFTGESPNFQGPQWVPHHFLRGNNLAYPWERYAGRYCGTTEQWAGDLRLSRPATDVGSPGCCNGDRVALPCACVRTTVAVHTPQSPRLQACSCITTQAAVHTSARSQLTACVCVETTALSHTAAHHRLTACTCVKTALSAIRRYQLSACVCDTPSLVHRAYNHCSLAACACVTMVATSHTSAHYSLAACTCVKATGAVVRRYKVTACACLATTLTELVHMAFTTFTVANPTAAGTTQGTATLLTADDNHCVVPVSNNGVILPTVPSGQYRIIVRNDDTTRALKVYPQSGAVIGGLGANNPMTISAGIGVLFCSTVNTLWSSITLT